MPCISSLPALLPGPMCAHRSAWLCRDAGEDEAGDDEPEAIDLLDSEEEIESGEAAAG